MGGIYVDFSVVNQLNSPALNSNVFANRPAAGQAGRLFVSTDTFEIYRDNGTTWDLIGGPGSSTITGTGTPGTLPIFTGAQAIGDSSLLEGSTKFTTSKSFQANSIYLNGMTLGSGALYYSGNRLTLANYNVGGDVMIEANGGAFAQFISGTDLSTTFYGNIIRNGGLSTQFLKADGSLDSTAYVSNNIYIGDGTLTGARTVTLNNHTLRLEGNANTARLRLSADNNIARIFSFATADVQRWALRVDGNESGTNAGANFQLRRYDDAGNFIDASLIVNRATGKKTFNAVEAYTTGLATGNSFAYTLNVPAGTTFSSPNSITALQASLILNLAGNATVQAGSRTGLDAYNTIGFSSTGTLTANQAGTLRAIANARTGWAFNGAATGTITHLAGLNILRPDNSGAAMSVTNNYGILINNQDTGSGTVTYTNRWGIYQEGSADNNFLSAKLLLGSAVDNGNKLQVAGEANISGFLAVGVTTTTAKFELNDGTGANLQIGRQLNNQIYLQNYNATSGFREMQFLGSQLTFWTGTAGGAVATQRAIIDSTGNFGLGVTPSAWGGGSKALQLDKIGLWSFNGNNTYLGNNYFLNSSVQKIYIANGLATEYAQINGEHIWYTAPSGTAGNAITWTQAMTLDASGRLGIGTPTPSARLDVYQSEIGTIAFNTPIQRLVNTGAATANQRIDLLMRWEDGTYNGTGGISMLRESATARSASLIFSSINSSGDATQAMRITSAGNVGIGTTSPGNRLTVAGSSGTIMSLSNGVDADLLMNFTSGVTLLTPTTGTLAFGTNNTERMRITSGGNVLVGTTTDAGQKLQVNGTSYLNGNVGVTVTPSQRFHVNTNGNAASEIATLLRNPSGNFADCTTELIFQGGYTTTYEGAATIRGGRASASNDGYLAVYTNPGGTSVTERLRVKQSGQVRFVPLNADPANAQSGDVYYNSGTNKLRLYDGTNWVDLN